MIYSYRCKQCGRKFTINCLYNQYVENPNRPCPKCLSTNTVRTYTDINAHFVGEGFTKSVREEEDNELDT